jgi:hypothetical protein
MHLGKYSRGIDRAYDIDYLVLALAKIVAAKVYDEENGNKSKIGFKSRITERPKHVKESV